MYQDLFYTHSPNMLFQYFFHRNSNCSTRDSTNHSIRKSKSLFILAFIIEKLEKLWNKTTSVQQKSQIACKNKNESLKFFKYFFSRVAYSVLNKKNWSIRSCFLLLLLWVARGMWPQMTSRSRFRLTAAGLNQDWAEFIHSSLFKSRSKPVKNSNSCKFFRLLFRFVLSIYRL